MVAGRADGVATCRRGPLAQPPVEDKPAIAARIATATIGVNRSFRVLNCFIVLMRWRISRATYSNGLGARWALTCVVSSFWPRSVLTSSTVTSLPELPNEL